MPRKNARPAARNRAKALAAKLAARGKFKRRASPIVAQPHFGDAVTLAALAGIFGLELRDAYR